MKIRRFALLGLILVLAVLCLPACGGSDGGDAAADEGAIEVVDSYLDVDEETGNYTVAVIVQNNSDTTISESMLESTAYDKDGNVIKPAEDSEGTMAFYPSFGVLQPGEKGAWIETNEYSDGATIWGIYTEIPDRLEWKVSDMVKGDGKEPSGLSVAGSEFIASNTNDAGETIDTFSLTLQNDSDLDYTFPSWTQPCPADNGDMICDMIAICRDESGKICGAAMVAPDPGTQISIPAGGSAAYDFSGKHFDGEPEFYLNMNFWRK